MKQLFILAILFVLAASAVCAECPETRQWSGTVCSLSTTNPRAISNPGKNIDIQWEIPWFKFDKLESMTTRVTCFGECLGFNSDEIRVAFQENAGAIIMNLAPDFRNIDYYLSNGEVLQDSLALDLKINITMGVSSSSSFTNDQDYWSWRYNDTDQHSTQTQSTSQKTEMIVEIFPSLSRVHRNENGTEIKRPVAMIGSMSRSVAELTGASSSESSYRYRSYWTRRYQTEVSQYFDQKYTGFQADGNIARKKMALTTFGPMAYEAIARVYNATQRKLQGQQILNGTCPTVNQVSPDAQKALNLVRQSAGAGEECFIVEKTSAPIDYNAPMIETSVRY